MDEKELERIVEEAFIARFIEFENDIKKDPEFWRKVAEASAKNPPKITFEPPPKGIKW